MKRTFVVTAAVAALAGALVYVSGLSAQHPASSVPVRPTAAAAAPRTKIALLNLTYVISYYEKYKAYKEEMKTKAKVYEDRLKGKQAEAEALSKEAKDPKTAAAQAEEIGRKMKQIQRDAEDIKAEGQAALAKEMDGFMVIVYREVQEAAQKYAVSHDFDLVLQYNEPLDSNEYYSAQNIGRKMNAGALIPLHYSKGMEISPDVLTMLNASYRPAAAAPAHTSAPMGN